MYGVCVCVRTREAARALVRGRMNGLRGRVTGTGTGTGVVAWVRRGDGGVVWGWGDRSRTSPPLSFFATAAGEGLDLI